MSLVRSRAALLRRRADLLEEQARVDRELADIESHATTGDTCSSVNLPADLAALKDGRRVFRQECASGRVDGASKAGKVWTCSHEAWRIARSRPSTPRVVRGLGVAMNDAAIAAAAVARAGLRHTRRAS